MGDDDAALTAVLPQALRTDKGTGFSVWLATTRHSSTPLSDQAKLFPVLMGQPLPPPADRSRAPLPLFDEASLKAFHLKPVAPAPSSTPTAAAASAAAASAAPTSSKPADIRFRIWELALEIHEVYTNDWPHTMERPMRARDRANPQEDEWKDYAPTLIGKDIVKSTASTLLKWRDAKETAPTMRQKLSEVVNLLQQFNKQEKQRQTAADQLSKAQQDFDLAKAGLDRFQKKIEVAIGPIATKYETLEVQYEERLEKLKNARAIDKVTERVDIQEKLLNLPKQREEEYRDMRQKNGWNDEEMEVNHRFNQAQRALQQALKAQSGAPPPQQQQAAAAAGGGPRANPPTAKRQRK